MHGLGGVVIINKNILFQDDPKATAYGRDLSLCMP